jgi:hypothetical protein
MNFCILISNVLHSYFKNIPFRGDVALAGEGLSSQNIAPSCVSSGNDKEA